MKHARQLMIMCLAGALCAAPAAKSATRDQILDALKDRRWDAAYDMARAGADAPTRDLATWYYLAYSDIIPEHKLYESFLSVHPETPDRDRLYKRMEIAFLNTRPDREALLRWFDTYPPRSSRATILHEDARGTLNEQKLSTLWPEADLSRPEEEALLERHRRAIPVRLHEQRLDRLLWDGMEDAASRMLPLVGSDWRALAKARLTLARNGYGAQGAVDAVPKSLRQHPGLLFERIRWRARRGDYKGVEELLVQAPARLPHAELWWPYQHRVIRDAIEDGRYDLARRLIDRHSQVAALPRVEAEWLRGWLYERFLKQPAKAAEAFENIYLTARLPISQSRGAYWTGHALEAAGEKEHAMQWYTLAARFPTTFYGQLAHERLSPGTPLTMTSEPARDANAIAALVRAEPLAAHLKRLAASGDAVLLWPQLKHSLATSKDKERYARYAALAASAGDVPLAINIAKEAQNYGWHLAELYPLAPLPSGLAIEPALALAVARQESRFDPRARSSADARGMMQLLPSTAQRVAARNGLTYAQSRLYEPRYNFTLGAHYMHSLLERFRGSLILAIAGYNAGPSRSDQWQERFGQLSGKNYKDNVHWTEIIPFGETRNYVQRVLENYHVYQQLLNSGAPVKARETLLSQAR